MPQDRGGFAKRLFAPQNLGGIGFACCPGRLQRQKASPACSRAAAVSCCGCSLHRARIRGALSAAPRRCIHGLSLLSTRYNSDRRLSDLSDYRRLADSPLAYRRSPTKSPLDYRRLPEAHADYARYSGGYGDYLPPARVHSGYQRRL